MLMRELIEKKRDGQALTDAEIAFMVQGYVRGEIPDYQMSAMLMAIYFKGMSEGETTALTLAMAQSGETLDLSALTGVTADKHSTGGVGDKTSLILCPMVASLEVKMAKMSGRGLGHTGGTIDKLESIPGLTTALSLARFLENMEKLGFVIAGQTADIDPADKLLYALRDVTGTVPSRPLIVSSIMSKKLAAGAQIIVLDVKTGSGAFMKTQEEARLLARDMVNVGKRAGRKTVAVITDMDQPLGCAVGNALEVKEAVSVLKGEMEGELLELCLTLGAAILTESRRYPDDAAAREALLETIRSGSALKKLAQMVAAQDGDDRAVYDTTLLPQAPVVLDVPAPRSGYVSALAADAVGVACLHLGGGRETKESVIDLSVGVVLARKIGDYVNQGEPLAHIHAANREKAQEAAALVSAAYTLTDSRPEAKPFILDVIR